MAANPWKSTRLTLEMIKWEHSVFALPFALTGAVLAARGWPPARVLFWIVVCMVSGTIGRHGVQPAGRCATWMRPIRAPRCALCRQVC